MSTKTKLHRGITFGLFDESIEFVTYNGQLKVVYNGIGRDFEETPEWAKNLLIEEMLSDKIAMKCLQEWEGLDEKDYLKQFTYCRRGGNDDKPDICGKGKLSAPEFVPCPKRETCRFAGKLCKNLTTDTGVLTPSLMKVIQNVELPDKLIADKLFKSRDTINTQMTAIRYVTGCQNKIELTRWSIDKGII